MTKPTPTQPCPCTPDTDYSACCGRFISGGQLPQTAEQLMRSRFSAFAKQNANYLFATVLPEKRERDELKSLQKSFRGMSWVKLEILATEKGAATDTEGTVEFRAHWQQVAGGDEKGTLRERSQFVKPADRWYYFDGEQLPE